VSASDLGKVSAKGRGVEGRFRVAGRGGSAPETAYRTRA
jgi:hypothetical protein